MKESATTAMSYVRSRADKLMLEPEFLKKIDLHVHIPRGGIARDGADMGIPFFAAVVSLLIGVPTRPDVAACGEVTLRGSVLMVDNVKDRILAAHRAGVAELVLPEKNRPDIEDVPRQILDELRIHFVRHADEALVHILERPPPTPSLTLSRPSEPPSEMRP
jgi:ATP-dependent Lon protease